MMKHQGLLLVVLVLAVVASAAIGWCVGHASAGARYQMITTSWGNSTLKRTTSYRLDRKTGEVWIVTPSGMYPVASVPISAE